MSRPTDADPQPSPLPPEAQALTLATLAGCGLAIAGYPRFRYDARGGGGQGQLGPLQADGRRNLTFPADGLLIPPLDRRSTRVLGLPLPPGLRIDIAAERLSGSWQPGSGAVSLHFQARFQFRVGRVYQAPDLQVSAELSTGPLVSQRHRLQGQPLDQRGEALLVGVALVPPSGDPWLDRFLGLPDEALALLRCRLRTEFPLA